MSRGAVGEDAVRQPDMKVSRLNSPIVGHLSISHRASSMIASISTERSSKYRCAPSMVVVSESVGPSQSQHLFEQESGIRTFVLVE